MNLILDEKTRDAAILLLELLYRQNMINEQEENRAISLLLKHTT